MCLFTKSLAAVNAPFLLFLTPALSGAAFCFLFSVFVVSSFSLLFKHPSLDSVAEEGQRTNAQCSVSRPARVISGRCH